MNIINLDRDSFWTNLKTTADVTVGTVFAPLPSGNAIINADPTVYDDVAKAKLSTSAAITVAAASYAAIGCYLKPPTVDTVPYRIKGYAHGLQSPSCIAIIGYGPSSPTGSGDTITPCVFIPFDDYIDEIVMIPALDSTDPDYGKPIAFGIGIGQCTSDVVFAHLSAQRMATTPPKYGAAVR